jgi:cbb3-type cytochrome oxidase subunit 3
VLSLIASAIGKAFASLVEWAVSFFAVFRAGEKAQANQDNVVSLKDATEARKIESADSALTDDELNAKLRGPTGNG